MKNLEKIVNYTNAEYNDEPKFSVTFNKNNDGSIAAEVWFENESAPPTRRTVKSAEQVGELLAEYIKSTASWM